MKTIGIKLADGTFYPIFEEGSPKKVMLELTTANDNQTTAMVDFYSSESGTMDGAVFLDTLQIDNLQEHPNGETNMAFELEMDESNNLSAVITDRETGEQNTMTLSLERLFTQKETSHDSANGVAINNVSQKEITETETTSTTVDATNSNDDFVVPEFSAENSDSANVNDFDLPEFDTKFDIPNFVDDLPDFETAAKNAEEKKSTESFTSSESASADFATSTIDNDFGDIKFSDNETSQNNFSSATSEAETETDFSLPEFDDFDFDIPGEESSDMKSAHTENVHSAINFDGLYDRETMEGKSNYDSHVSREECKKKSRLPVAICVVCAIICVVATILILFVLPSKYNLFYKTDFAEMQNVPYYQNVPESPYNDEESERVIIEQLPTENPKVVPAQPVPPTKKPDDKVYVVKWGDTLWDIANAYYRNPWLYKRIADYNDIKNPDYIVSGQRIRLPADWTTQ